MEVQTTHKEHNLTVGVDIVEHKNFERFNYHSHPNFYHRVFSPDEIDYCLKKQRCEKHFAGLFAIKEAVWKACSLYGKLYASMFEIGHLDSGKPVIKARGRQGQDNVVNLDGNRLKIECSLSHSKSHSVAISVVQKL